MAASAKHLPSLAGRPYASRWDYALLAAVAPLPVLALIAGAPARLTVTLLAPALVALQWFVWRRGGWRLIGPHAYYDLIRQSRKGRIVLLRTLFLCAVVGAIYYTYEQYRPGGSPFAPRWLNALLKHEQLEPDLPFIHIGNAIGLVPLDASERRALLREQMARLNIDCVFVWFLLQNAAILLLTPAYLGGAIAEERERGTLEMLLATGLYNREIVLGKLAARLAHLGTFLLAGLPIFSIMLVWGGIDLPLLLASWIHSAALLLTVGCACMLISTMPIRASTCIISSYIIVLPVGWGCVAAWHGGLQDLRMSTAGTGSAGFAVLCGMAAVYAVTIAVSLFVTIKALRVPDLPTVAAKVFPPPTAANPSIGYTGPSLPPLNDNALVWKERYTGGKSILLMPHTVLLLATPLSLAVWLGLTLVIDEVVAAHPQGLSEALGKLSEVLGPVLHGSYAVCLACYSIGVAFRAAASVVRERQMRTLDLLLQIPIERREILAAKGWGALARGWPWLALLVGNVAVGLAIGAYHPLSGLFLAMLPAPLALALCSAGLLISVYARTPQRANVFMGMVLLPLAGCCGLLGPALNRALVFRLWQGGVIERRDLMAAVSGAGLLLGFAVAFWLLAVPAFERTSRR